MAGPPSALPHAFHPGRIVLDQPGRAMVRLPDQPADPPWRPPERPGPRSRHPRLDQDLERRPPAIRVEEDRRGNPRLPRTILPTNFRRRTLAAASGRLRTAWSGPDEGERRMGHDRAGGEHGVQPV